MGLVLLVAALAYPGWLFCTSWLSSASSVIDLPLHAGEDRDVPVHVGRKGNFTLSTEAVPGPSRCQMAMPDSSYPNPCAGTADTLHFHFRLIDSTGKTVAGDYGVGMEGAYPDEQREYGAFDGPTRFGAELLTLQPLTRGDYRLQVTAVQVPAPLAAAQPRVTMHEEGNIYAALMTLPFLLLSALLGIAGLIFLIVAAFTRS